MSNRKALLTTREVVELLGISRRTLYRWIRKGLLTPRLQYVGGTHLRFLFLCSEVCKFLDNLPTPRTLADPKMLKLLDLRRGYVRKARAARGKDKPRARSLILEQIKAKFS